MAGWASGSLRDSFPGMHPCGCQATAEAQTGSPCLKSLMTWLQPGFWDARMSFHLKGMDLQAVLTSGCGL